MTTHHRARARGAAQPDAPVLFKGFAETDEAWAQRVAGYARLPDVQSRGVVVGPDNFAESEEVWARRVASYAYP